MCEMISISDFVKIFTWMYFSTCKYITIYCLMDLGVSKLCVQDLNFSIFYIIIFMVFSNNNDY